MPAIQATPGARALRLIASLLIILLFNQLRAVAHTDPHLSDTPSNTAITANSEPSHYYLTQYLEQAQNSDKTDKEKEREERQKRKAERKKAREAGDGEKAADTKATDGSNSPAAANGQNGKANDQNQVTIDADDQQKEGDTFIATGYVVIVNGASKLQADKVIYNSVSGEAVAEGNVVYDPDPNQRITAQRATINVLTRKGTFYEATGFTDQTSDGATLNFTAEQVDKTGDNTYKLIGAQVTACEQAIPAWSFEGKRATIRINRTATIEGSTFHFRNIPLFYLPAIKFPIGQRPRKSGFLIPSTGNSTTKGRFFQDAYYQTLGRSADILLRGDIYSKRGLGFGTVFRARPDELSSIKLGTFTVVDRIFDNEKLPGDRDEGGTLFFAKGVQYLPHGFLAAVDIDYTSSLAFRRTFANEVEQIFNPEKRSQLYLTNNFSAGGANYSFNILAESKSDTLFNTTRVFDEDVDPNLNINIRHLPSFELIGYGQQVANLPLYLSFDTTAEGLYRRDRFNQTIDFITPSIVQRFDMSPKVTLVVPDIAGWIIRPEFRLRSTYYSSSLKPPALKPGAPLNSRGKLNPDNIFRKYSEFAVDVRPPSFARTFNNEDGTPRMKHVIEPFITYRNISGIDNFDNVIRFDARDAVANTNEVEYGVINRFFTPKVNANGETSTQETLSIALTQKYFFDPTFGGALRPGARNQFYPIDSLSGFSFGGRERRFSPLNLNVRYRPLSSISADVRMDYDTMENRLRNFSIAGQFSRRNFSFSERFYHSATLQIAPGLIEPGTFPGSLLVSNFTIGNENRGYYGGGSFTYDFTNRRDVVTGLRQRSGLRRSSAFFGYACDCGNIELDFSTINVNGFNESRITFTFTLAGIGAFGTDRNRQ